MRSSVAAGFWQFMIFLLFAGLSYDTKANSFDNARHNATENAILDLYKKEWGAANFCSNAESHFYETRICSPLLRNEGNGPFILSPIAPKATVVLFHGLSDSPFYVRAIAEYLYQQDYEVIAPLLPGHGIKAPDADMQDPNLRIRWYQHVDEIMQIAHTSHNNVFIGGYSTGGTLSTRYAIKHAQKVRGLLLFSGAMALPGTAETLAKVWGMKTIAKWVDGDYLSDGPHPFKYPKIGVYSALVLLDVINEIRDELDSAEKAGPLAIFAAHSLADRVTMYDGIADLLTKVEGNHMQFKVDKEFDVCHADLVMNTTILIGLKFDRSRVNTAERCKVPKANPQFNNMMMVLSLFMSQQLVAQASDENVDSDSDTQNQGVVSKEAFLKEVHKNNNKDINKDITKDTNKNDLRN
uniref:alpha/beta hydrolase n=1 Tax=Ningiella ruwaisensis TaxID=2364274 RepID=UPI0010A059BD|nr:alpha/beta fold hydrolase [Ningiella ruwaisensis]